jgi:EamA-like transporter family.
MIVLAPYSLTFEAPWKIDFVSVPYQAWLSILYLSICSTFIASIMFIRLIREHGSVQASSVTYLMPIVSIILDVVFLGKLVRPTDMIGVVVIFLGVYLIQKKKNDILT